MRSIFAIAVFRDSPLGSQFVAAADISAHLSQSCGELFGIENEVLLYNVTSTYFDQNALKAGEGGAIAFTGFDVEDSARVAFIAALSRDI